MSDHRHFLRLALLTVGLYVACFALWQISEVVWVDFIHSNPDRTRSDSWVMIALSPLYATFFTTLVAPLPVIAGLVALKAASRFYEPVPAWLFAVTGLLCGAAFVVQTMLVFPLFDEPIDRVFASPMMWIVATVAQIPFIAVCWWWLRRSRKPVATPAHQSLRA